MSIESPEQREKAALVALREIEQQFGVQISIVMREQKVLGQQGYFPQLLVAALDPSVTRNE